MSELRYRVLVTPNDDETWKWTWRLQQAHQGTTDWCTLRNGETITRWGAKRRAKKWARHYRRYTFLENKTYVIGL